MVAETILCDLSDANSIIKEIKNEWIVEVLSGLGIAEDIIELGLSGNYEEYISAMNELGISIELFSGGEINIYKKVWFDGVSEDSSGWLPVSDKHLIAQWKRPEKIRRVENSTGKLHYEIHFKQWSVPSIKK